MRYYTYRKQVPKLKPGEHLDFRRGKGYFVVPAKPPPPPPPKPPPPISSSVFVGKGAFSTSDPSTLSGLDCDWFALQMDPEGNESPLVTNNPGRLCYWQARPSDPIVRAANEKGVPFIAQAEKMSEIEVAIGTRYRGGDSAGLALSVPKALVGNPGSWTKAAFDEAVRQRWELILEWYWNAQPSYAIPDAAQYPYLRNVCFGIYSEGVEGGDGYVPQSKSVADYRAVWAGSFSVWKSEAMTAADRAAFNVG